MAVASIIALRVGQLALNPSPIYANRVLEGNPVARNKVLSSSDLMGGGARENAAAAMFNK
jgi:hypothetical protein